ncbi:hypothetical protein [Oceanobacillus kimchii]
MAEIKWKSKEEQDKENEMPNKEEMNSVAILELAEIVSEMAMKGGE